MSYEGVLGFATLRAKVDPQDAEIYELGPIKNLNAVARVEYSRFTEG